MKKDFTVPVTDLKAPCAATADLYLDGNFLLWPSFSLLDQIKVNQLLKYNIRVLKAQDQPDFMDENTLQLQIEVHAQNQEEPSLLDKTENRIFWQSYQSYFSFVEKTLQDFKKTGKINVKDLSQPYTTFNWKLRESKLGTDALIAIREVAFNDPNNFHIHLIISLTILATLQGAALELDTSELRDLASASLLCTLGLFLIPLNQKKLFSPGGFLAHSFTEEERKAYETYPILSHKIALKNQFNETVCNTVLNHREQLDQKGFPYRPPSFRISPLTQILGMTYQLLGLFFGSLEKQTLYHSFVTLYKNESHAFDRNLLKSVLDLIVPYKPRNIVQLANGSLVRILKINKDSAYKPYVMSLESISENLVKNKVFIAGEAPETEIVKVLNDHEVKLL